MYIPFQKGDAWRLYIVVPARSFGPFSLSSLSFAKITPRLFAHLEKYSNFSKRQSFREGFFLPKIVFFFFSNLGFPHSNMFKMWKTFCRQSPKNAMFPAFVLSFQQVFNIFSSFRCQIHPKLKNSTFPLCQEVFQKKDKFFPYFFFQNCRDFLVFVFRNFYYCCNFCRIFICVFVQIYRFC